jgi:SH3-like domain-containing protein
MFLAMQANDAISAAIKSGKCDPYYVSIRAKEAHSHVGPGRIYKVVYKYIQEHLPVKVVAQYDNWRKIEDPDGEKGWIHKSLLSTKRFIITCSNITPLMLTTKETSKRIARIKKKFVMELIAVRGNWCRVKFRWCGEKYTGWVRKTDVFGVLDEETW